MQDVARSLLDEYLGEELVHLVCVHAVLACQCIFCVVVCQMLYIWLSKVLLLPLFASASLRFVCVSLCLFQNRTPHNTTDGITVHVSTLCKPGLLSPLEVEGAPG